MNQQTLTTRPPATSTPTPPTPAGLAWNMLVEANPSLQSWERSAATAGARNMGWWIKWATTSRYLMVDISQAIAGDAPEAFHQALTVARAKIRETFEAARLVHCGPEQRNHVKGNVDRQRRSAAFRTAKR
jgi:hypothetical protein